MSPRSGRTVRRVTARSPFDPSFEPGRASRFANFGNSRWCRVLIEFASAGDRRAFARANPRPTSSRAEAAAQYWVPAMYANPPSGMAAATSCTAIVKVRSLNALRATARRVGIRRMQLGTPVRLGSGWAARLASLIAQRRRRPPMPNGVVTGIIDDGLAVAHERFRIGNGTRIEWFWDQNEPHSNPAPNWDYGRELCKHDQGQIDGIDTMLALCTHSGIVDEDEFYQRTGVIDFGSPGHKSTARRSSHGTHVMDLACGDDPATARNDRPIICVQLPARTTADTSGGTLAPQVLDALWYMAEKADRLPLVVNLSYGLFAGPHDGSGDLERVIRQFVTLRSAVAPTAVVLPAGNSYLARCHAHFRLGTQPGTRTQQLSWRVLPDDRTDSSMEIWLPHRPLNPPRVRVRVRTPGNLVSNWVDEGQTVNWGPSGPVVCSTTYAPAGMTSRGVIRVTLNPTSSTDGGTELAEPGIWQIEVRNASGTRDIANIHAWIQRDDKPHGYPTRGRQSRFEDPRYVRFEEPSGRERETDDPGSYVRRASTINAIATGTEPVVIGGFRRSDLAAAKYSSSGPTLWGPTSQPPLGQGPDAMAVSEDSAVCHGVLAAGSRSGGVVAINGTSIAAPQVTRELVDVIATGVNPKDYVRLLAQAQEAGPRPVPPYKPQPNPARGGWGRIVFPPIVPVQRFEP